jgi:hypothetical protein
MALHTVAVPSDPAQDHNRSYSGTLIRDLMELVDEVEQKHSTPADDDESIEPEDASAPLTIDEVLAKSRALETQNPYLHLLERVLA